MTMNSLPRRFGKNQGYLDRDHRNGRRSDSDSDEEMKGLSHEEYRRHKRLKMRKSARFCFWDNTPSPPRDPNEESDENADEILERDENLKSKERKSGSATVWEHRVKTACGVVSVIVHGDREKPALITYPDLALNHLVQLGAAPIRPSDSVPSADDLADQILEVLNFFRLGAVMCMGVTAGAYILTLFAMKHRDRVLGLILVSPVCKAPTWSEWFYNKVMSNLLYFYGMCGVVKVFLLQRYFSKEVRCNIEIPVSDIAQACRRFSVLLFSFLIHQILSPLDISY